MDLCSSSPCFSKINRYSYIHIHVQIHTHTHTHTHERERERIFQQVLDCSIASTLILFQSLPLLETKVYILKNKSIHVTRILQWFPNIFTKMTNALQVVRTVCSLPTILLVLLRFTLQNASCSHICFLLLPNASGDHLFLFPIKFSHYTCFVMLCDTAFDLNVLF